MMTPEQVKTVQQVLRKFLNDEKKFPEWSQIDEYLSMLEWLDDHQIYLEAKVHYEKHKNGTPRCTIVHNNEECFVPLIIEAAVAIFELYEETERMHLNNRYILSYYIAFSQTGDIIS